MSAPKAIDPADLILVLMERAKRAYNGDKEAEKELCRSGELLAFAGGFEAMAKVQGLVHDYEIQYRPTSYSLASTIGACWEHIPEWANA
jgi:hypothetical protein